jgi:hypothetical protein
MSNVKNGSMAQNKYKLTLEFYNNDQEMKTLTEILVTHVLSIPWLVIDKKELLKITDNSYLLKEEEHDTYGDA